MIIEVESVYGDKKLYGNYLTLFQIKKLTQSIWKNTSEKDFIPDFLSKTGYEEITYDTDVQTDIVIDLDTHRVYRPRY